MGSTPQFVDLNNDGNIDLISGNYAGVRARDKEKWEATKDKVYIHGDIYVFHGRADGSFDEGKLLLNKNGDPVTRIFPNNQGESNVENLILPYAFDPHMVDWDLDGDLDLLLGWMEGTVVLIENLGDAHTHSFSDKYTTIEAGGEVFNARMLSGPFMVDFDADGKRDLLVSSYYGDVFFLKNNGTDAAPQFAEVEKIITGFEEPIFTKRISNRVRHLDHPAMFARVEVRDYNNDGKVDIIFGDNAVKVLYKKGLSDERKWEIADAMSRANALTDKMISGRKSGELSKENLTEMQKQVTKLREDIRDDIEYRTYSHIWLFIRK